MSKAERYIELVSDENGYLCDQHALKAVEIAMEEIYEWLSYHLDTSKMDVDYKFEVIEELKKAMKNE